MLVLSEQQKRLVQFAVAKARSEHRFLNAPSSEDFALIYAAVAKELEKLNPTTNPDPATIPNPILRQIFEETRNDMVKYTAGRYALDSDIVALREAAKRPQGQHASIEAAKAAPVTDRSVFAYAG